MFLSGLLRRLGMMCVNHFTHLNHPTMLRLVCSFYLHFSVNSLSLCSSLSGLSSPCCIPRFFLEKVHVGGQDIHSIYLVYVNNISYEMSGLKSKSWINKWGKYTQWASSAACLDLKFNLRTDFYSIFIITRTHFTVIVIDCLRWKGPETHGGLLPPGHRDFHCPTQLHSPPTWLWFTMLE